MACHPCAESNSRSASEHEKEAARRMETLQMNAKVNWIKSAERIIPMIHNRLGRALEVLWIN